MRKLFWRIFFALLLIGYSSSSSLSQTKHLEFNESVKEKNDTQSSPWSNSKIWKDLTSKSRASFSVKINKSLPDYTFTLNGSFKDQNFHPDNVIIINSKIGKTIQKLNAKGKFDNHGDGFSGMEFKFADFIQFLDLNSDGYLDLRLLFNTGATGNNWYATYIFDPKVGKYKYHQDLSILSGVKYDNKSKVIKTYWRGGWCEECCEYFKLDKDGRLILNEIQWTEMDRVNTKSGCLAYTAVPKNRNYVDMGYTFYMNYDDFIKNIRKTVKNLKKQELTGSLDGRSRGPLGTPIDN